MHSPFTTVAASYLLGHLATISSAAKTPSRPRMPRTVTPAQSRKVSGTMPLYVTCSSAWLRATRKRKSRVPGRCWMDAGATSPSTRSVRPTQLARAAGEEISSTYFE